MLKKISHEKIKNLLQFFIFESVHADVAYIGWLKNLENHE